MAKRKRGFGITMPAPPSPEEQRRWSAESMARTMVETDPEFEARRKELTQEILSSAKRVMSGSRPFVKRRPKR